MPRRLRIRFPGIRLLRGDKGIFTLSLKPASLTEGSTLVAPAILTQPQAQTVTAPNAATFTVFATGTAPLTYQWYRNGVAISGATYSGYTISPTATTDTGAAFYCVVTNSVSFATSNTVALTVLAASGSMTPFRLVRTDARYATLANAVTAAISGDTIKVTGGTYTVNTASDPGNLRCTINTNTLTIEAEDPINNPAIVNMSGLTTNVPGDILYVRDPCKYLTVRGIHMIGSANLRNGNASGIWSFSGSPAIAGYNSLDAGALTVEYCKFQTFGNGILTAGSGITSPNFTTSVRYCVFDDCGGDDGRSHGIYCGANGVLNVIGCTFKTTTAMASTFDQGHMLKSRAKVSNIYGNKFDPVAGSSTTIDFGTGGTVNLLGNIIFHYGPGAGSLSTENPLIKYGHDQMSVPGVDGDRLDDGRTHAVFMSQNTLRKSPETGTGQDIIVFYAMVDEVGTPLVPAKTIRSNIVGASSSADDRFVSTYGATNTNAGTATAIADDGMYSGGLVAGSYADAAYAWADELTPPVARTDTYRGGLLGVPYALPAAGSAVTIGVIGATAGSFNSVKPSVFSDGNWQDGVFGAFGGGALVEDYSDFGAFVVAGSGGHNSPSIVGAAIFDFATATWTRKDNANGVAWRTGSFTSAEIDQSDGSGFVEGEIIAGSPRGIPAPGHLYGNSFALSTANGGGTLGSIALAGASAVDTGSGSTYGYAYRMDLATGLWTKFSTNSSGVANDWTAVAYDPTLNRLWHMRRSFPSPFISYLPLGGATGTWQQVLTNVAPSFNHASNLTCWDEERLLLTHTDDGDLWGLDLTNVAGGWRNLALTGTMPGFNKLHLYPPNGKFYTCTDAGTVYELTPPADPWNGTWVATTRSFGLPSTGLQNDGGHNVRFFYVPSIQCLAWVPGNGNYVYILRP